MSPSAPDPPRVAAAPRSRPSWPLVVLVALALGCLLHFGKPFFVPLVLAALGQMLLSPFVRGARRVGVPAPLSAALLLGVAAAALGLAVVHLAGPARTWVAELPRQVRELRRDLAGPLDTVKQVSEAAASLDEMTDVGEKPDALEVAPVSGGSPVLAGATALAQVFTALVLLYAMIAGGDGLLRGVVRVVPRLTEKRLVVEVAHSVVTDVSRYLLTITLINAALGAAIALAMWMIGLPNPILWGLMAALLNFVPYAGAMVGIGVVGLVATASFDGPERALAAMGSYAVLTILEGGILTPLILGRTFRVRLLFVLLWLLWWGLSWGIVGALTAIPLLVVFKIVCDHVPALRPIALVLADEPRSEADAAQPARPSDPAALRERRAL